MKNRNGKIARLPHQVREELNRRLRENDEGKELVDWLNALPEVQEVLKAEFLGRPINESNLTHWRQGGYEEWLWREEAEYRATELSFQAKELREANGRLVEHLATDLLLRYAAVLSEMETNPEKDLRPKLRRMWKMCRMVSTLRGGEIRAARLKLQQEEEERLRIKHEKAMAPKPKL